MLDVSKYVGIPFKNLGRTIDGLDCWGLFRLLYKDLFNIDLPSLVDDYDDALDGKSVSCVVDANKGFWYPVVNESPGDGIILRLAGFPMHVGMVVEDGMMIHTHPKINSCVESYKSRIWRDRLIGFYRYPK